MKFWNVALPTSAVILLLLVIYKQHELAQRGTPTATMQVLERPAPRFEAYDAQNRRVRLERYLGRHPVLLVFFDAKLGAAGDPLIQELVTRQEQLAAADVKVVAVSAALPQQNRLATGAIGALPLDLLTDPEPHPIHEQWGRLRQGRPQSGLFLIDRAGRVAYHGDVPRPTSVKEALRQLTGSR